MTHRELGFVSSLGDGSAREAREGCLFSLSYPLWQLGQTIQPLEGR